MTYEHDLETHKKCLEDKIRELEEEIKFQEWALRQNILGKYVSATSQIYSEEYYESLYQKRIETLRHLYKDDCNG